MNTLTRLTLSLAALLMIAMWAGCSTSPESAEGKATLEQESAAAIESFKAKDPGLQRFFDSAAGYAVFPNVGKGGAGVGGAYGKGVLYERGVPVGYCDLKQATIGLQLGGQAYSELIFFQNADALQQFKSGNFAFSAQASAVAATAGAATTADYDSGVLVFTLPKGGLMYEASIGGQKFDYDPR
jgi:lipid-binding SYLF domain-containing protein